MWQKRLYKFEWLSGCRKLSYTQDKIVVHSIKSNHIKVNQNQRFHIKIAIEAALVRTATINDKHDAGPYKPFWLNNNHHRKSQSQALQIYTRPPIYFGPPKHQNPCTNHMAMECGAPLCRLLNDFAKKFRHRKVERAIQSTYYIYYTRTKGEKREWAEHPHSIYHAYTVQKHTNGTSIDKKPLCKKINAKWKNKSFSMDIRLAFVRISKKLRKL